MMKPSTRARTKSAILLIGTLLLGMVLGGLLQARMAEERMERIAHLRSPHGFIHFFESAVQPESPEQQQAVRAILDRSAREVAEASQNRRGEMRRIIHQTKDELSEVLTDAQNEELEGLLRERKEQHRERMRERKQRKGPR